METKFALILSFLITILIALNANFFSNIEEQETSKIMRIIDGDTLVLETGETARLENINTPERGEAGYEESKNFLRKLENSTVKLEKTGTDKYGRTLGKIYDPEYFNLKIVRNGFAVKYLVDISEEKEFLEAENFAIENSLGNWKRSQFSTCTELEIIEKEKIAIKNSCRISMLKFEIKEEGRKKYKVEDIIYSESENELVLIFKDESIWRDKNTFYLFDENHFLVDYDYYGY